MFQPREFFRGFDDVEEAPRHFDLKVNAPRSIWAVGCILDPFRILSRGELSNPGINWPRWNEMSSLNVVVLAIRLAK